MSTARIRTALARLGLGATLFFLVKGIAWLVVFALAASNLR